MTPSSKLGTRIAVGAIIAVSVAFASASIATRASGAARVSPVAGSGAPGSDGDGGPATQAKLSSPAGVAVDGVGDVIIVDTGNCRVREVPTAAGTNFGIRMRAKDIYTIAGSTCGSAANGGPATNAKLAFPTGVALDLVGDVFVADSGNNEVHMITVGTGAISTIAGPGDLDGPTGVAMNAAGDLFIADTNNCRVREVPAANGTKFGMAMTSGHIYTIAGTGTCGYSGNGDLATRATLRTPTGVAVDAHGNVLIADTGNRVVREVATGPGTNFGVAMTADHIYTVAGSGTYNVYFGDGLPAASDASSISFPQGIAVDPAGDLYVADTYARAVRAIPTAPGTSFGLPTQANAVFTIAGAGPAESPTAGGTNHDGIVYPSSVAVDARGKVYVADTGSNSVEQLAGPG